MAIEDQCSFESRGPKILLLKTESDSKISPVSAHTGIPSRNSKTSYVLERTDAARCFFRLHVPVAADLPFIHTRTRKGPPSPEEVTVVQALIRNDSEVRLVWVFLISFGL